MLREKQKASWWKLTCRISVRKYERQSLNIGPLDQVRDELQMKQANHVLRVYTMPPSGVGFVLFTRQVQILLSDFIRLREVVLCGLGICLNDSITVR